MKINTKIDVLPLVDKTMKAQKNLVFSTEQGLNRTARQIQAAQQDALQQNFTLRSKKDFLVKRIAVIKPFASVRQGRMYAEVAVNAESKRGSPLLLPGYEAGDPRKPVKGKHNAVPINSARPRFTDTVKPEFTFQSMKMKAMRNSQGKVFYA